jgi:hypothetical protein
MRRTRILDNDPNSIFSASRKLATIANHNMKNPIQNDAIQQDLNSLPSSLNNQLNNSLLPTNNNSILINKLPSSQPIKADVNVDEFLSMISETNNSIEALHILINNYDENSKVEEDDGGVLYRPKPNSRRLRGPRLQGGMVNDDDNEDDVIGAEEGKSGDEYKNNNTPDTKFGMDDIYNTKMSPEPSSNEQRQSQKQIQNDIVNLNDIIHNENKNLKASQTIVTTYENQTNQPLRKYIGKNINQKSFFTDQNDYKNALGQYDQRNSTPTNLKPKAYKIVKDFEDKYGTPPIEGKITHNMFKEYKRYVKNLESIERAKSAIMGAEKDIELLTVRLKNIDVEYKFDDSEQQRQTLQNQFELAQEENQNKQQQIQEQINELNAILRDKEIAQNERKEIEEEKKQLLIEVNSIQDDYNTMQEQYRERYKEHEEEIEKLNATTIEQTTKRKQAETLLNYSKNTNPVIDLITRTNSKMNQLFIFFKGKIKPNLKSISKSDIQNMITDIQQLYDNHVEVYNEIIDKYNSIFTINNKTVSKKTDAFLETFSKSFDKSYNEIINNLQSFSSLGNYSTSSVPNGILFNSKVPTFNGKGLQLVPDVVRRNMHHNHKYLL